MRRLICAMPAKETARQAGAMRLCHWVIQVNGNGTTRKPNRRDGPEILFVPENPVPVKLAVPIGLSHRARQAM